MPELHNDLHSMPVVLWWKIGEQDDAIDLIKGIKTEYMKSRLELIVILSRIRQSLFPEFAKFCRILDTRTEGEDIAIRISGPREHIRKLLDKYPDIKTTIVI